MLFAFFLLHLPAGAARIGCCVAREVDVWNSSVRKQVLVSPNSTIFFYSFCCFSAIVLPTNTLQPFLISCFSTFCSLPALRNLCNFTLAIQLVTHFCCTKSCCSLRVEQALVCVYVCMCVGVSMLHLLSTGDLHVGKLKVDM